MMIITTASLSAVLLTNSFFHFLSKCQNVSKVVRALHFVNMFYISNVYIIIIFVHEIGLVIQKL